MRFRYSLLLLLIAPAIHAQEDLNEHLEKAIKDAAKKVAPSVVQIITQGGGDMVVTTPKGPSFRKALGPTTGVIVSQDGYIISSLFNFLNNPTTILVSIPGQAEPVPAKRIANDRSRMLALLKIDAKNLPVPEAAPKSQIVEGLTTIALGRTLEVKKQTAPSISTGIISATGRIWGKALQTDAKISPINYGGPLVDLQGRVQGILIPASPNGEDVTSGFEWYDSGIGFAIPFQDVLEMLPKLKQGKDWNKGILGIRLKNTDIYSSQPEISQVNKGSSADKAGLQPGDQIVEIEGIPIFRLAQLHHVIGTKYEGDRISLKYKRGDKLVEIKDLELVSSLQVATHAFLGILPLRDDPRLGVEIRYVFAGSPADKAGLKIGERIVHAKVKVDGPPPKGLVPKNLPFFTGVKPGREQFLDLLNAVPPGTTLKLEIKDKEGKSRTVTANLDTLPGSLPGIEWTVPEKLPKEGSFAKALQPLEKSDPKAQPEKDPKEPNKAETGFFKRNTADGEHQYWVYVPKNYDPNKSMGVIVWLHQPERNKEGDFEDIATNWEDYCIAHGMLMVMPKSDNASGWIASESEFVVNSVQEVAKLYTVDRQRIIAHGQGIGGQMALYLGMMHRDLFRGVATVGAVPTNLKDNQPNQRLAFWLAGGELDPLVKNISEARVKLAEKRFSAVYREIPNRGREYLSDAQLNEVARWIETLDKQ